MLKVSALIDMLGAIMRGYSVSIHRNATVEDNGAILNGVVIFSTFGRKVDNFTLRNITHTRQDWPRHKEPQLIRAGGKPTIYKMEAGELPDLLQALDTTPISDNSSERHRASTTVAEYNIPDDEPVLVQLWDEE